MFLGCKLKSHLVNNSLLLSVLIFLLRLTKLLPIYLYEKTFYNFYNKFFSNQLKLILYNYLFVSLFYSVFNEHLTFFEKKVSKETLHYYVIVHGGDDGIRTHDPLLAGQVLSQLSYTPRLFILGFCRFSVFNLHKVKISLFDLSKNFTRLRISLLTKSKISLQAISLLGRPKWTRTTDLVLIRHAL